jgi:hypothetical protein
MSQLASCSSLDPAIPVQTWFFIKTIFLNLPSRAFNSFGDRIEASSVVKSRLTKPRILFKGIKTTEFPVSQCGENLWQN